MQKKDEKGLHETGASHPPVLLRPPPAPRHPRRAHRRHRHSLRRRRRRLSFPRLLLRPQAPPQPTPPHEPQRPARPARRRGGVSPTVPERRRPAAQEEKARWDHGDADVAGSWREGERVLWKWAGDGGVGVWAAAGGSPWGAAEWVRRGWGSVAPAAVTATAFL